MIDLDLARLIAAKGGRPLGVFIALGTLFLPSALLVYLTRPDFYARYGIVGGIFFGAAVGFPMVWVCCWPWYVVLWAALKQERITKRLPEAFRPGPKPPEPSLVEQATAEDPLEWPTLVMGAWLANGVLYLLVVIAYYRPLLLGATLLLTAGIVLAVWLVLTVLLRLGLARFERETEQTIESIRRNAAARPAAP
jgi:hypothetical protein